MTGNCSNFTSSMKSEEGCSWNPLSLQQIRCRPIGRHILLPGNASQLALCCRRDMSLAGSSSLRFPDQAQNATFTSASAVLQSERSSECVNVLQLIQSKMPGFVAFVTFSSIRNMCSLLMERTFRIGVNRAHAASNSSLRIKRRLSPWMTSSIRRSYASGRWTLYRCL